MSNGKRVAGSVALALGVVVLAVPAAAAASAQATERQELREAREQYAARRAEARAEYEDVGERTYCEELGGRELERCERDVKELFAHAKERRERRLAEAKGRYEARVRRIEAKWERKRA